MRKSIDLTIGIPVFNTNPKLIERLLNSIIQNKKSNLSFECLIVDDFSTNLETIKYLNDLPNWIKIIRHDKNKGLGPSRNTIFNNSKGNYIWFIDSDDYINDNSFKFIKEKISNYKNIDFITINVINDYGYKKINASESGDIFKFEDLNIYWKSPVWSKIINTNFLRKNNIFHLESNLAHEDEYFSLKLFYFTNKKNIISIDEPIYIYNRTNYNSITKTIDFKKSIIGTIFYLKSFLNEININEIEKNSIVYKSLKENFCLLYSWLERYRISFKFFKQIWKEMIEIILIRGVKTDRTIFYFFKFKLHIFLKKINAI